jgi:hypothetical protein
MDAYQWNHSVKSTFKALDFQPILFTSGEPFDRTSMIPYLNHKLAKSLPQKIVVAVTLALTSSVFESSGEEMKEERVWQTKAEIVTEGFFD